MVDVRISQIVRETSASNDDADVIVSQIVRLTSVTVVPAFIRISQIVRLTSVRVFLAERIRLSQLTRLTSVAVPPIGTACLVEPISSGIQSFFGLIDADWIEEVEMETEWLTDVSASKVDLAEDRTIAARRPVRSVKVTLSGMTQKDMNRLAKHLGNLARARNAVPLWQDRCTLQATALSGVDNELFISTAYRRFYSGQHVAVARPDRDQISTFEYAQMTIASVLSDRLVLTSNVSQTLLAGWDVYPMIDCEIVGTSKVGLVSDYYGRTTIQLLEISGCSTLPASSGEDISGDFDYIDSYPVLDVGPNWRDGIQYEISRQMESYQSGRSAGVNASGARAVEVFEFDFGVCTRAAFWKMLKFHDSRRGRGRPFWVLHPQTMWSFMGSGLDYIDVNPFGYANDIPALFSHIAYIQPDGTIGIRPIVTATRETAPARHRIHLNPISVAPPSVIDRVTAAILCREDSDSFKEVWTNEELCTSLQLKCRGLLAEGLVSIG